jgi:hypothetical protein
MVLRARGEQERLRRTGDATMLTHLWERAQLRNQRWQRYPTDGDQRVDLVFSREAAVRNSHRNGPNGLHGLSETRGLNADWEPVCPETP